MRYLLDADILSYILRKEGPSLSRFLATKPNLIALSSVTLMEVHTGFELKPSTGLVLKPALERILVDIAVLDYDQADALSTAQVRTVLQKLGKTTGSYDAMLIGVGLARGLTVVTNNTKNFVHAPGLKLENWNLP
jgi:tRNA(fMet)-specific endonuclease VapC